MSNPIRDVNLLARLTRLEEVIDRLIDQGLVEHVSCDDALGITDFHDLNQDYESYVGWHMQDSGDAMLLGRLCLAHSGVEPAKVVAHLLAHGFQASHTGEERIRVELLPALELKEPHATP